MMRNAKKEIKQKKRNRYKIQIKQKYWEKNEFIPWATRCQIDITIAILLFVRAHLTNFIRLETIIFYVWLCLAVSILFPLILFTENDMYPPSYRYSGQKNIIQVFWGTNTLLCCHWSRIIQWNFVFRRHKNLFATITSRNVSLFTRDNKWIIDDQYLRR